MQPTPLTYWWWWKTQIEWTIMKLNKFGFKINTVHTAKVNGERKMTRKKMSVILSTYQQKVPTRMYVLDENSISCKVFIYKFIITFRLHIFRTVRFLWLKPFYFFSCNHFFFFLLLFIGRICSFSLENFVDFFLSFQMNRCCYARLFSGILATKNCGWKKVSTYRMFKRKPKKKKKK